MPAPRAAPSHVAVGAVRTPMAMLTINSTRDGSSGQNTARVRAASVAATTPPSSPSSHGTTAGPVKSSAGVATVNRSRQLWTLSSTRRRTVSRVGTNPAMVVRGRANAPPNNR